MSSERCKMVEGIQFVVDDAGKKTAVIINLERWGTLWEDIYDVFVSESRRDEPGVPWETLKAEIATEESQGKGT
jgi:hypothetical protein